MAETPKRLKATIRDFITTNEAAARTGKKPHADFEFRARARVEPGIVDATLGPDGKPKYIGGNLAPDRRTTNGPTPFYSWFNDDPDYNESDTDFYIELQPKEGEPGTFFFFDDFFFPIDNRMLGNEGRERNFHFTLELKPHTFTYRGSEKFTFTGDDDLWVFINGKLVIDLGGTHFPVSDTIDLTLKPGETVFKKTLPTGAELELVVGRTYEFVLFFAERHTFNSQFRIETSFDLEPPPTVKLLTPDPEAAEKPLDPGKFLVVLDQEAPLDEDLTVFFTVEAELVDGKEPAVEGKDYQAIGRSVVIPKGLKEIEIPVIPLFDEEIEGDEPVKVTLRDDPAYQRAMPYSGTVIIKDYNPIPVVSVRANKPRALEPGNGQEKEDGEFMIELSEPSLRDLTIAYMVAGTAQPDADYSALPSSVTFKKGETVAFLPVVPKPDALKEPEETVVVLLQGGDGYQLHAVEAYRQATVTIVDAPPLPVALIRATIPQAAEPGNGMPGINGEFTIQLDRPAWTDLTIHYTVSGSAEPSKDYQPLPATVLIPKGQHQAKLPVVPLEDQAAEGDETVIVTLQPGSGYELDPDPIDIKAVVIITDLRPVPIAGVSAPRPNAKEPGTGIARIDGLFRIYLDRQALQATQISYLITGTATSGSDYEPLPQSVTIAAGQDAVDIPVIPKADAAKEAVETVILTLQDGPLYNINAAQAPIQATVNITDTPPPPVVSIVATKPRAQEPGNGLLRSDGEFRIQMNSPNPGPAPMTIRYRVSGTAAQGVDYQTLRAAVIPPGQSLITLPVVPIEDLHRENAESVVVTLEAGAGYGLHPMAQYHSATVTIIDAPLLVATITAIKDPATEPKEPGSEALPGGQGRFLVKLDRRTARTLSVNYGISGTARPGRGNDYLLKDDSGRLLGTSSTGNRITLLAGIDQFVINVVPLGDSDFGEKNETVVATLEPGNGYQVGSPSRDTVTIVPYSSGPGHVGGDR